MAAFSPVPSLQIDNAHSYFVTELLGTDLHRLLTSRPLEKQFIQYFLYQILVKRLQNSREITSANLLLSAV